jgi:transcriptional regulator with XRE-family HTH domain
MRKLRELREARGWTLGQVSQALGCVESTICRYEAGLIDPPLSKVVQLAAVLGVRLEELIDLGPPAGDPTQN